MAYGNPFGGYGAPMYGYPAQMMQPMPDQLAQLRGAQPYQPMQQTQQSAQQPQQASGLLWVQGEAGARGYLVAPGQTIMLLDSERPTFYIKSADASGVPSMRIFDYKERTAQAAQAQDMQQYATRAEVEEIKTQISAIVQQTNRANRHVKEEETNEQPAV